MIHSFDQCLKFGENPDNDAIWNSVWRRQFPDFSRCEKVLGVAQQKRGTDRLVYTGSSSQPLRVQEKVRARSYGDMLFEWRHTPCDIPSNHWPGWMELDQDIDFIGYCLLDSGTAYVFPWQPLRRVWLENKEQWLFYAKESWGMRRQGSNRGTTVNGITMVRAKNKTYNTWNVCVPVKDVFAELGRTMTHD